MITGDYTSVCLQTLERPKGTKMMEHNKVVEEIRDAIRLEVKLGANG